MVKIRGIRDEATGRMLSWHAAREDGTSSVVVEPGQTAIEADVPGDFTHTLVWPDGESAPRESTAAESLKGAKVDQEAFVRDQANAEYNANTRSFEGTIVAAKWGRGLQLDAREQQVFNTINADYQRLRTLVTQIQQASTEEAVKQITW